MVTKAPSKSPDGLTSGSHLPFEGRQHWTTQILIERPLIQILYSALNLGTIKASYLTGAFTCSHSEWSSFVVIVDVHNTYEV